jgi:small conductance mechanosensitive channel
MLEGSTLTAARVVGIVVGVLVVNVALRIALGRFFTRAERGDAERIASLRQVARTAQRVVLTAIGGLLVLDTLGIKIAALVAALGVIGLAISFGAQPLIRDIIGYVSFVFADNFRAGEEVAMDGKRGEVLKFELRGVVLRVKDDGAEWLAYVPYSKIGTVENFDRAIDDA